MTKRILFAATALALLSACQAYPTATPTGAPVLEGRADFPTYNIQAASSDITDFATVSLIDDAGVARMAGVTDASGHFTLFQSTTPFSPVPGDVFTLNVTKRVSTGATNQLMTLRTVVRRDAGAWSSISGATVVVNMATTAAVKFDEQHADVDVDDLFGVVSGSAVTRPIGAHSAAEAETFKSMLADQLADTNDDPSAGLVYHGDVTLTTLADIKKYADYDVIDGELTVKLAPGVTTLSLPNLKTVTGYVSISGEYGDNADLANLDGLSGLTSVGGLSIYSNPKLKSLQGLSGLTRITESGLSVQDNGELISTAGLENVEALGTSQYGADLYISNNAKLTTVVPMKLTRVSGILNLGANPLVTSYAGLGLIETVGGRMQVEDNDGLTTIGLSALTSVGDDLSVRNNPAMTNIGLPALTTCTMGVQIAGNDGLINLAGLDSLTQVGEELGVSENAKLANLSGLGSLTTVGGSLGITSNPLLTSLTGLKEGVTAREVDVLFNASLDTDCSQAPLSTITSNKVILANHHDTGCQ